MKLDLGSRDTALEYAERGWAVLPLLPRKKDPHFDLAQRAYLSATTAHPCLNYILCSLQLNYHRYLIHPAYGGSHDPQL